MAVRIEAMTIQIIKRHLLFLKAPTIRMMSSMMLTTAPIRKRNRWDLSKKSFDWDNSFSLAPSTIFWTSVRTAMTKLTAAKILAARTLSIQQAYFAMTMTNLTMLEIAELRINC